MTRQEVSAWSSLGFSSSLMFFYLVIVFGWPQSLPDFSGILSKVFFYVFWVALGTEIYLEIRKGDTKEDENYFKIEAKSLKRPKACFI